MRHLLRRAALTGAVLAATLVVASPAFAGPDKPAGTISLGDDGASPILAWSWGITNTGTIGSGSGGAGSGKVTLGSFNITKRINPLSTELTQAAATGRLFPEVVVSVPIGGPGAPFAVEYKLRPVFVESLQQSGSGDESTESVTLGYGAFSQTVGNADTAQFGFGNDG